MDSPPPRSRDEFRIAIFCSTVIEAKIINHILDQEWEEEELGLGKTRGDSNYYKFGRIRGHNVVIIALGRKGGYSANEASRDARRSFEHIIFAFLVGYCGAVPSYGDGNRNIFLGHCIISTAAIQYDFGSQYPDLFKRKTSNDDSLPRSGSDVSNLIAGLQANVSSLEKKLRIYLTELKIPDAKHPGVEKDFLFPPSFIHNHGLKESCNACLQDVGICGHYCEQLGCEDRLAKEKRPDILAFPKNRVVNCLPQCHFGPFATANTVMKSGKHRDDLADLDGIIAFEMEARGLWEILPTIVIKGVSDYADSHKNEIWQPYAACVAVCTLKAIIANIPREDPPASRYTPIPPRENFVPNGYLIGQSQPVESRPTRNMPANKRSLNGSGQRKLKDGGHGARKCLPAPYRQASTVAPLSKTTDDLIQKLKGTPSLLQDGEEYWSNMTIDGYKTYKKLFESLQCTNDEISIDQFTESLGWHLPKPDKMIEMWKRFVPDGSQTLPRPYVLALLYMLHIEHFQTKYFKKRPEIADDLLTILLAFSEWVKCPCKERCGLSWNFVSTNWGWYSGNTPKKGHACLLYQRYSIKKSHRNEPPRTPYHNHLSEKDRSKANILHSRCRNEWIAQGKRIWMAKLSGLN